MTEVFELGSPVTLLDTLTGEDREYRPLVTITSSGVSLVQCATVEGEQMHHVYCPPDGPCYVTIRVRFIYVLPSQDDDCGD